MLRLAKQSNWMIIEQDVDPDPLEIIEDRLFCRDKIIEKEAKHH